MRTQVGSQYTQLIARRVRESRVYCEIFPHDVTAEELARRGVVGVILSGGPSSVYDKDAPRIDPQTAREQGDGLAALPPRVHDSPGIVFTPIRSLCQIRKLSALAHLRHPPRPPSGKNSIAQTLGSENMGRADAYLPSANQVQAVRRYIKRTLTPRAADHWKEAHISAVCRSLHIRQSIFARRRGGRLLGVRNIIVRRDGGQKRPWTKPLHRRWAMGIE